MGEVTQENFAPGYLVTQENFAPGYLVTRLRDRRTTLLNGGIGLYAVSWERLEQLLGISAGRLSETGCGLRKVRSLEEALDQWRRAGHRGHLVRVV